MTETRTILDAAAERLPHAETRPLEGYEHVAVRIAHPSSQLSFEDLERFANTPRRVRQHTTHETPQSFCAYVNSFAIPEQTRVFASLKSRRVVARIDFHQGDTASWGTHVATYPAALDEAFGSWAAVHDKAMAQRTFADFLEDRAADAIAPEPADLMEVAAKFEAVRNVDFKSAINVSTNERQFRYEEKDAPAGGIAAPKVIRLRTPVFYGCDPVEWGVRLAYKIDDGKLFFTVKIHRMAELLDAEFERLCDAIAVDCPSVAMHRGVAE